MPYYWCLTLYLAFMIGPYLCGALNCTKDEKLGWYDLDNVYTCPDAKKCCMEAQVPTCCEDKPMKKEILDQVILWGSVIGATLLIGLLICMYRRDQSCCEGGRCCKCCCCSHQKSNNIQRPGTAKYNHIPPPSPSDLGVNKKIGMDSKLAQLPGEVA